jgi:hypothetical protein
MRSVTFSPGGGCPSVSTNRSRPRLAGFSKTRASPETCSRYSPFTRTGTVLVDPSHERLAAALGFATEPDARECDLAIIGAGPPGSRLPSTAHQKGSRRLSSTNRCRAGRPGRARAFETTSASRRASPGATLRTVLSSKPGSSARESSSQSAPPASRHQDASTSSNSQRRPR